MARTFIVLDAGLALKTHGSFVKGLTPFLAGLAGFFFNFSLSMPASLKDPFFFTSDAATAIAKHLTEEADSDPEEIAKFLQAYADLMVRKSAQTSSAGAMPPIALSGRADLIEDTLVATLRKIKGVLSIDKKEDIELFQFLAGMLTSRGNSAALSKDEWKELKERLTQTAFF